MIRTRLVLNTYQQNPFNTKARRNTPNHSFLSTSRLVLWTFLSLFRLLQAVVAKQSRLICLHLRSISRRKRKMRQTKSLIRMPHLLRKPTKSSKHTLRECSGTRETLAIPLLGNATAFMAITVTTTNRNAGGYLQHVKENNRKKFGHASKDLEVQLSNASDTDQSHEKAQYKTNQTASRN